MLKYLYAKEIFKEVPDEITLGISISGCKIRCKGCHSPELWKDEGTPLDTKELMKLLEKHKGITCVCFFGGEHDLNALGELIAYVHYRAYLRTAWYSGLDGIPEECMDMMDYLDYIKIGRYIKELGGLDSPTTNQRLYKIEHLDGGYKKTNITHLLQKQNEDKSI
jgi:anaerobic ribonucleoside-triphosphate reductase activating protein